MFLMLFSAEKSTKKLPQTSSVKITQSKAVKNLMLKPFDYIKIDEGSLLRKTDIYFNRRNGSLTSKFPTSLPSITAETLCLNAQHVTKRIKNKNDELNQAEHP